MVSQSSQLAPADLTQGPLGGMGTGVCLVIEVYSGVQLFNPILTLTLWAFFHVPDLLQSFCKPDTGLMKEFCHAVNAGVFLGGKTRKHVSFQNYISKIASPPSLPTGMSHGVLAALWICHSLKK